MDTHEDFGDESSQFMLGMRITIEEEIHNRDGQYEVGNPHLCLPIYRQMCEIVYSSYKPENVFLGNFLSWNGP